MLLFRRHRQRRCLRVDAVASFVCGHACGVHETVAVAPYAVHGAYGCHACGAAATRTVPLMTGSFHCSRCRSLAVLPSIRPEAQHHTGSTPHSRGHRNVRSHTTRAKCTAHAGGVGRTGLTVNRRAPTLCRWRTACGPTAAATRFFLEWWARCLGWLRCRDRCAG